MRKLLISILLILLIVMTVLCVKNGINIGPLHVLGVTQIQDANGELTRKIAEAKNTNDNYANKLTEIKDLITDLGEARSEYLQTINVSTESEIREATQTKNYTIEYLWSQVGNHATQEGVNIKMDVVSGVDENTKNLNFTVSGNYLAITNFITELENDSSLQFTIDEFAMTQNQCTFVVRDVFIRNETTMTSQNNTTTNTNSENAVNANTTSTNTVDNTNEGNITNNTTVAENTVTTNTVSNTVTN